MAGVNERRAGDIKKTTGERERERVRNGSSRANQSKIKWICIFQWTPQVGLLIISFSLSSHFLTCSSQSTDLSWTVKDVYFSSRLLIQAVSVLLMMHLLLHFLSQHHTNLFCVSAYLCSGNLFLEMFHFHWNPPLRLFPIIQFNSVLSLWPWLLTLLANQWSDGYVTQFLTKKQQWLY